MQQEQQTSKCEKCGCSNLHVEAKKFDVANALTGMLFAGPLGLLAGKITDNSLSITCIECGFQKQLKISK